MSMCNHDQIELRETMIKQAESFLNIRYKYGGRCPLDGLDCSQVLVEALKVSGHVRYFEDLSAKALFAKLSTQYKVSKVCPGRGALVFWFKNGKAVHCGICLSKIMSIQASGGDGKTKTLKQAIRDRAYVKYKRIDADDREVRFIDIFPEIT